MKLQLSHFLNCGFWGWIEVLVGPGQRFTSGAISQPSHRLLQKSKSMTHVTCLDMHETAVLVIIAGFLPTGHGM